MTPHKQLFRHDPENGVYGDCHRTAIACLLDLHPSEVPHIYREGRSADEGRAELNTFLSERFGLLEVEIPFGGNLSLMEILAAGDHIMRGRPFILGGKSSMGCGHSVIAWRGKIEHDPSQNDSGIVGPMDDDYWWITFLVKDVGTEIVY